MNSSGKFEKDEKELVVSYYFQNGFNTTAAIRQFTLENYPNSSSDMIVPWRTATRWKGYKNC